MTFVPTSVVKNIFKKPVSSSREMGCEVVAVKKKKSEITANTATRNLAKLASPWGGGLS